MLDCDASEERAGAGLLLVRRARPPSGGSGRGAVRSRLRGRPSMHELRVKHCASATTHVKHCASHVSVAHAAARGDGDHEGGGGEPDRAELNSPFRDRLCDACDCHQRAAPVVAVP